MLDQQLFTFVTAPVVTTPSGATMQAPGTNNEAERTLRNPAGARDTGRTTKTPCGSATANGECQRARVPAPAPCDFHSIHGHRRSPPMAGDWSKLLRTAPKEMQAYSNHAIAARSPLSEAERIGAVAALAADFPPNVTFPLLIEIPLSATLRCASVALDTRHTIDSYVLFDILTLTRNPPCCCGGSFLSHSNTHKTPGVLSFFPVALPIRLLAMLV
jgi:hypothetical protein